MSLLLSEIAAITGNEITHADAEIKWLLTDSRTLSFPQESIFFALVTPRNDGHKFIEELYRQNLRYFVVSKYIPEYSHMSDAVFIQVNNTLDALQQVVAIYRNRFNIPVVGITGSNGKTIVKEWLYQLLHIKYKITRSPRSFNSQIGVPLSVWGINQNTELAIIEAGISQPGEMAKLEPIIHPTIGIFTNLGEAHQENFSSLKQKCAEKLLLFKNAETVIYNADNKVVAISLAQAGLNAKLFSWGKAANNHLQLLSNTKEAYGSKLQLLYNQNSFDVSIPFQDNASVENSMHCIAFMLCMDIAVADIQASLTKLETVAMRLEVKDGIKNCLIINDSYNSDLNSLNIALDFLQQQSTPKNSSRTLILSDILQSGLTPDELYTRVSDLVRSKVINRFVGIGNDLTQHADKFSFVKNAFYPTTDSFLKSSTLHELENEVVLLKGSRNFHFEHISDKLELIAHETTMEVNLNALVDNLNYFRSKLKPETRVMSMVKAFAYGSGATEIARTLQHHRCDYLAVAVADEGVELRREGIRIPIAVMNPELGSLHLLFDNKLEPEIYSFRLLKHFMTAAEKQGVTDYPIHIKIDSGMHRLGFEEKDMQELVQIMSNQSFLKIRSVFSHLAGADDPKLDYFTHQQVAQFIRCADILQASSEHKIMRHILNSAGTERFPEYQFDMIRLGIGHYGISAIPGIQLRQVCTLKTVILQTKTIQAGETVGYSRKGTVDNDKRIAILPVGYADGFDRKLSNGVGEVWINGQRAKVIGNVSMDLIAVDITGIEAAEGDKVEIFGENLLIEEVAGWLKTIPYEILTSISRRVKRVYFQE